MVPRPGGDCVSAKGWWMRSYTPCSQLWEGRTQTIRWVGQMGTSSQPSLQVLRAKWSQERGSKGWELPTVAQTRTGSNYPEQGSLPAVSPALG